jgi:serine/threonine-protein phosphatase 5
MASAKEQALALKAEGNKAFSAHDWPRAIELYAKAIELYDEEPTFFLNRAQVRLLPAWCCHWCFRPCG